MHSSVYCKTKNDETESTETVTIPEFVRGTTPIFEYTVLDYNGDPLDLEQFGTIKVCLAQKGSYSPVNRLTLDKGLEINGNTIRFRLSEAQSLVFNSGLIAMQVYGKNGDTDAWSTLAEDVTVRVRKSLKDGDIID